MLTLSSIGSQIVTARRKRKWTQAELGKRSSVSRATIEALENGRLGELGFSKVEKILAALGMELKLQEIGAARPTLEQLMQEDSDDQSLDRRR